MKLQPRGFDAAQMQFLHSLQYINNKEMDMSYIRTVSFLLVISFLLIHCNLLSAYYDRRSGGRGYSRNGINWYGRYPRWPAYYAYYGYPLYGSTYYYSYPLNSTYYYSYPSYYSNYTYPSYPYNGSYYINNYRVSSSRYSPYPYRRYSSNRTYFTPSRQTYNIRGSSGVFLSE